MQLNLCCLLVLACLLAGFSLFAQEGETADKRDIEIDFLSNYYSQDGDHAAVTGGIGTEKLTDAAQKIVITVPTRDGHTLSVASGLDIYSSASSNMVDPVRSGASGQDARVYGNLSYTIENAEKTGSYGLLLGGSTEFDYRSVSFGGTLTRNSQDQNRQLSLSGQVFFDNVSIIRPIELRPNAGSNGDDDDDDDYSSDPRRTYSFSATWSQVLGQRLQAALNMDVVYQTGFLSTPFHRVYFAGENLPRVETLPDKRLKIPFGVRLNAYLSEYAVSRLFYRYYYDDFGVTAHTLTAELPLRFNKAWSVIPFYRYHNQTAADYFSPFEQADPAAEFYTSDYDLSAFSSNKYGMGLRYYPLSDILKIGDYVHFKKVELRAGLYDRSDGLSAFTVTADLSFYLR